MSGMLENLTNPVHKDQLEERMSKIKEDPSLKPILDEIESGGPAAMMRSCKNVFSLSFLCIVSITLTIVIRFLYSKNGMPRIEMLLIWLFLAHFLRPIKLTEKSINNIQCKTFLHAF